MPEILLGETHYLVRRHVAWVAPRLYSEVSRVYHLLSLIWIGVPHLTWTIQCDRAPSHIYCSLPHSPYRMENRGYRLQDRLNQLHEQTTHPHLHARTDAACQYACSTSNRSFAGLNPPITISIGEPSCRSITRRPTSPTYHRRHLEPGHGPFAYELPVTPPSLVHAHDPVGEVAGPRRSPRLRRPPRPSTDCTTSWPLGLPQLYRTEDMSAGWVLKSPTSIPLPNASPKPNIASLEKIPISVEQAQAATKPAEQSVVSRRDC